MFHNFQCFKYSKYVWKLISCGHFFIAVIHNYNVYIKFHQLCINIQVYKCFRKSLHSLRSLALDSYSSLPINSCNDSSWIQHPSIIFSLLFFEKRIEFWNQCGPLYVINMFNQKCEARAWRLSQWGLVGYSSLHRAFLKIQSLALGLPDSQMKKNN